MISKFLTDNKGLFWDSKLNNGAGGLTILGAFTLISLSSMAHEIVIQTINEG